MKIFAHWCTSDFQRRGRPLKDLSRFKAVEFRLFLLYAGPFALKGLVPDKIFNHFIILHFAMSLLLSPSGYQRQAGFARELLKYFVVLFRDIHGVQNLIFNVHSLIHLADVWISLKLLLMSSAVSHSKTNWAK